ncbi:MAG: hypothetical protein UW21_C0003G0007 [Candidatus Woesebacteria bacterium GW2011_GWB1_44_11b]|uniref:Uncharacterized protein n=1 Tax=Candidatus Woesebacteria bacterium GW2011_GWB1_44_11b TaxID=1618580 RepID=A0A0G1GI83_9BACT|nr:MAG: hypothetical protein UW21_C0003G0007 [Candidatus Woesebacteria bacterium GW2011_GWB1_44_11b]
MEERDARFSTQEIEVMDKLIDQNERNLQKKLFLLMVKSIHYSVNQFTSKTGPKTVSLVEGVYTQIIAVQEEIGILEEEEWLLVKPLLDKVDQKLFGTKR